MSDVLRAYLAGLIAGFMDAEERKLELATSEAERYCPDGVVDIYEYPEFAIWRETHKVHRDPGGVIPRCPRCYSSKVRIGEVYIQCLSCRYSEFLWD